MVERGEIAADDFVLGVRAWPLGRFSIRQLPCTTRNIAPGSTRFRKGETLMKRLNESRLRKLEEATSGVARNVVIIAYGPGETAADAAERHFARRPEDLITQAEPSPGSRRPPAAQHLEPFGRAVFDDLDAAVGLVLGPAHEPPGIAASAKARVTKGYRAREVPPCRRHGPGCRPNGPYGEQAPSVSVRMWRLRP